MPLNTNQHKKYRSLAKSPKSPGASTSSSSSSENNDYLARNLTYSCDCTSLDSICNPLAGKGAGMTYKGFFSVDEGLSLGGTPHVLRGGLERTISNRGTFFCQDAEKLFSMSSGGVRMKIILPYDISSGVYEPLQESSEAEIEDYVIWAVNMGESYISQPGIYAALTPSGIEFTIWSSAGKYTAVDSFTNYSAGEELLLEFFWDEKHLAEGGNMSVHSNGTSVVRRNAVIKDDKLSNLYDIVNEFYSVPKHAEFVALDSPLGNHGLNCTITWLETHSTPPLKYVKDNNSSSSSSSFSSSSSSSSQSQSQSSSSSSYLDDSIMAAKLTFPFTFFGGQGANVEITNIETATVSKRNISLNSCGANGAVRDLGGNDNGGEVVRKSLPSVPLDLPLGIYQVKDLSI